MTPCLRLAYLLALGLILSCQPEDQESPKKPKKTDITPEADTNGSRLRIRKTYITGSDGTRLTIPTSGFHDSKLDVDCVSMTAEDLQDRCIPYASPQSTDVAMQYGSLYYFDSSCLRAAAAVTSCKQPPRFLLIPKTSLSNYCQSTTLYSVYTSLSIVHPLELYAYYPSGCAKVSSIADLLSNSLIIDLTGSTHLQPTEFVSITFQLVQ